MKFDYGTQLSPFPIELSIGTLIKPRLSDIAKISFERFGYYEFLLKMSPETFYTKLKGDEGAEYWDSLSEMKQEDLSLYDVIIENEDLINTFIEIFNFFFLEDVIYKDGYFVILKNINSKDNMFTFNVDNVHGIIYKDNFLQILEMIQQICCISDESDDDKNIKFKNALAERLYKKMKQAAKESEKRKQGDRNFTLPNIISAVSNNHQTINPINIWDLTIFQLMDAFERLRVKSVFDIDSIRVSVWGDEKKTFNAALWYKNEYDKNSPPNQAD